MLNVAQIRKFDVANGPGIRTSLFVSGCTHNCPDCFNQDYMHFKYGQVWDDVQEKAFLEHLKNPQIKGVTILGGEPMDQIHDEDLLRLVRNIKLETNKELWIYSGYTFEEICAHPKRFEILKYCDVLIDGPFVTALKDFRLKFRGSSNQRLINVQASLNSDCVVLHDLN